MICLGRYEVAGMAGADSDAEVVMEGFLEKLVSESGV